MTSGIPKNSREPHFICPITGFLTPISEALWQKGRWVSEEGYDRLGYKDRDETTPSPHNLHLTRRTRGRVNPQTGEEI